MEQKIHINLNELKLLKESPSLVKFGAKIKRMLYHMFAPMGTSWSSFFSVSGNPKDIQLFMAAISSEKRYMDSFLRHGLNDKSVLNNRYALEKSVSNFERETGIKWPLK